MPIVLKQPRSIHALYFRMTRLSIGQCSAIASELAVGTAVLENAFGPFSLPVCPFAPSPPATTIRPLSFLDNHYALL